MSLRITSWPLRVKLIWLASLSSAAALIIAGGILAVSDYKAGYKMLENRIATHARVTALHSSAAVAFSDADAAHRILEGLKADPAIVKASISVVSGGPLSRVTLRP